MAKMKGHLTLIGDNFNPNNVTILLHIQPNWIKTKHEILGNDRKFGHYEWGFDTNSIENCDLEPIVSQLVEFIKPRSQLLAEVAKNCCAVWNILFDISSTEDFPAIHLRPDFIRLASEINAEVGFDSIIYSTQQEGAYDEDYPFKDDSKCNVMAKMKGHLILTTDDWIPNEIVAQLNDHPNRLKTKHKLLDNGKEFDCYEWSVDTDLIEHYDLEPVVNQLMVFMKSRTNLFAEIARNNSAIWKILFSISSTDFFPATYFSAEFIRLAAEINAEVGFNLIIYPTT